MTYQRKSKPEPSRMLPRAALAIGVFALISIVWTAPLGLVVKPLLSLIHPDDKLARAMTAWRILGALPWIAAASFVSFFYMRRNR